MIPGPDYVYECPKCGQFIAKESMMSGNTFEATIYSDGKTEAPMLLDTPEITRCRACGKIFWLGKSKLIGSYDWKSKTKSGLWFSDRARFLTLTEYFMALNSGLAENPDEELYIRRRIWWAYNDRIRRDREGRLFLDDEDKENWKMNCDELLRLLDPEIINHRIMAAEIHRNLGDFEECKKLLQPIQSEIYDFLKSRLLHECDNSNRLVVPLKSND